MSTALADLPLAVAQRWCDWRTAGGDGRWRTFVRLDDVAGLRLPPVLADDPADVVIEAALFALVWESKVNRWTQGVTAEDV